MDITISGVNYKSIIDGSLNNYYIIPFDASGNILGQMTIEVNQLTDSTNIYLPEIANLNNQTTEIIILAVTVNGNNVFVNTSGGDTIGSSSQTIFDGDGQNAIFRPISSNDWSMIYTS